MPNKTTWPKREVETEQDNDGTVIDDSVRRDQLKLVYDYIKFHIALYLATPTALALIADAFDVKRSFYFAWGLIIAAIIFLGSGVDAAKFIGRHILRPWQNDYLQKFESDGFSNRRISIHHKLYWLGLAIGVVGFAIAILTRTE